LFELVGEVAARMAALPAPANGQVRAIPDDRTIRYYGTIGLLDRPAALRGRTALYGARHLAQIIAIKRLQSMGRSLAEIQALWPTLDDATLSRMSGIALVGHAAPTARARDAFWKRGPAHEAATAAPATAAIEDEAAAPSFGPASPPRPSVELRIELAPNVVLSLSVPDESVAFSPADVRAIRAAAAPLVAELAGRQLTLHPGGHPV
jgi:DNA-binding transcriptional MerR regulator